MEIFWNKNTQQKFESGRSMSLNGYIMHPMSKWTVSLNSRFEFPLWEPDQVLISSQVSNCHQRISLWRYNRCKVTLAWVFLAYGQKIQHFSSTKCSVSPCCSTAFEDICFESSRWKSGTIIQKIVEFLTWHFQLITMILWLHFRVTKTISLFV